MKKLAAACALFIATWAYAQDLGPMIPHTVFVPDHVYATDGELWEFATVVAPPGTLGCAGGRIFVMGSDNGPTVPILYQADLLCVTANCATDVYNAKIKSDPDAEVLSGDFVRNDVVMTRRVNGELLIARDLRRDSPKRRGIMIWGSTDCGDQWEKRFYIDPGDIQWDAQGRFAKPRADGFPPGWDRQEIYADPWAGHVFVTAKGVGGQGRTAISQALLFRSEDGRSPWTAQQLKGCDRAPIMMTSLPGGRLFLVQRNKSGLAPQIRWSTDGGKTLSKAHDVFAGEVVPQAGFSNAYARRHEKEEGTLGISRIRHFTASDGVRVNQVRVIYPAIIDGHQVARLIAVTIREDGSKPTVETVRTISLKNTPNGPGDIVQATFVEADPVLVGDDKENTALIYWREIEPPATAGGTPKTSIRGRFVRGTNTFGPVFSLSTNSSGNKRQWSGGFPLDAADSTKFKTGDYSKGGFYFDAASKQLRYWAQWIETTSNSGNSRTLHGTILEVPR